MAKPLFERLANQVRQLTKLLIALKYCVIAAISLWASIAFSLPSDLPPQDFPNNCTGVSQQVLKLSSYQAADVLFFEAHPERNGALIRAKESVSLKNEWWQYYEQVVQCKRSQQ